MANHNKPPPFEIRIQRLRVWKQPRQSPANPESRPEVEIKGLRICYPTDRPPEPETPTRQTKPSLLTWLIPAWPDPEFRRYLLWKIVLPLVQFTLFTTAILIISSLA